MVAFNPLIELYYNDVYAGALTGRNAPLTFDIDVDRYGVATASATFIQDTFNDFGAIAHGIEMKVWYNKAENAFWGRFWVSERTSNLSSAIMQVHLRGQYAKYQGAYPIQTQELTYPTYEDIGNYLSDLTDTDITYGTWSSNHVGDTGETYVISPENSAFDTLKTLTLMDEGGYMATDDLMGLPFGTNISRYPGKVLQSTYQVGTDVEDISITYSDVGLYTHLAIIGARQKDGNNKKWVFPRSGSGFGYLAGITPALVPFGSQRLFTYNAQGINSEIQAAQFWNQWQVLHVPMRPTVQIKVINLGESIPIPAKGEIKVKDLYGQLIGQYPLEGVRISFISPQEGLPRATFEVGNRESSVSDVLNQIESNIINRMTVYHGWKTESQITESRERYNITARNGSPPGPYTYDLTKVGDLSDNLSSIATTGGQVYGVGQIVNVVNQYINGVRNSVLIDGIPTIDLKSTATDGTYTTSLEEALGYNSSGKLLPRTG